MGAPGAIEGQFKNGSFFYDHEKFDHLIYSFGNYTFYSFGNYKRELKIACEHFSKIPPAQLKDRYESKTLVKNMCGQRILSE